MTLLLLTLLAVAIGATSSAPPNILLFLVDDLGFGDVGFHADDVISPNIDQLAAEGVILDQSYAQPVCTPSRGALLTGLYPFHAGLQHNVLYPTSRECAPHDKQMISEALKDLGYATHLVGKWHLGFCDWSCTPTYRGFDTFYGFYNGYISHYTHEIAGGYDWRDGKEIDTANNGSYSTWLMRDRTIDLINSHDPSSPFFLFLSLAATHIPLEAPQEYYDLYADEPIEERRKWFKAMLTAVDDAIKDIMDAFKASGLYDNSIVIFTADNGGEDSGSSNAPLRGTKGTLWEGGIRIPTAVNSPLLTKTGYTNKGLFHETDWFPTLISMAGGATSGLDGYDQTDMILNGGASVRDRIPLQVDIQDPPLFGRAAMRVGDWKLIAGFPGLWDGWDSDPDNPIFFLHEKEFPPATSHKRTFHDLMTRHYNFDWAAIGKTIVIWESKLHLFNLADDPTERNNLIEVELEKKEEMLAILDSYVAGVVEAPKATKDPAGHADKFGGVWTPGWCPELAA